MLGDVFLKPRTVLVYYFVVDLPTFFFLSSYLSFDIVQRALKFEQYLLADLARYWQCVCV